MKPEAIDRDMVSSGSTVVGHFGIDLENQASVLAILRDRLYTNKILAVIREYSANAWDEHRQSGNPDVPIQIVLPTDIEPTLIIRDFGRGLPESEMERTYIKYGKSTKTDSNAIVGMLGIGAKSGFAYSDSFSITSWNGGMKKVYVAVLDATNVGILQKLHEEPCGDETGIEIKIPVIPKDIPAFQRESRKIFPFFRPLPDINLSLPAIEVERKGSGYLLKSGPEGLPQWIGIMGCIPYRIDLEVIRDELVEAGVYEALSFLNGGLYFDIGEVEIAANREELEYSNDRTDLDDVVVREGTKTVIVKRLLKLVREMQEGMEEIFLDRTLRAWEKRHKLWDLSKLTGLPIPREFGLMWEATTALYDDSQVFDKNRQQVMNPDGTPKLKDAPEHFRMKKLSRFRSVRAHKYVPTLTTRVPLDRGTRFIIKDNKKHYQGYVKNDAVDMFIVPITDAPIDVLEAELKARLKDKDLEGVPIERASLLTYVPISRSSGAEVRPNHSKSCFVLRSTNRFGALSENWEAVNRVPQDTDVFVVLAKFASVDGSIYYTYDKDKKSMEVLFGEEMPPVYGYKTTEKKPVRARNIPGDNYFDWRKEVFEDLEDAHPEVLKMLELHVWVKLLSDPMKKFDTATAFLGTHMDGRHRLLRFLNDWKKALLKFNLISGRQRDVLSAYISQRKGGSPSIRAQERLKTLKARYPLLFNYAQNGVLYAFGDDTENSHRDHWIRYIQMIDENSP